jgi:hypothetical protein
MTWPGTAIVDILHDLGCSCQFVNISKIVTRKRRGPPHFG